MIDSKLLPEFQTAELLQPLSGPKAEPRNPSPEKQGGKKYISLHLVEKRSWGGGGGLAKKNLNKCLPSFCCQAVAQ